MSRQKFRIHNTAEDNLISNLRGEVGEIISSWILMRDINYEITRHLSNSIKENLEDQRIARLNVLSSKLSDEIISRLSELGKEKIGRLNFYFASVKLDCLKEETKRLNTYIEKNRFREKRNYDISHKELPEKWEGHKDINIPPEKVVKGIAMTIRLMKKLDRKHLGPSSRYLWREMRKKKYKLMNPPRAGYMLLPYLKLNPEERINIIKEEQEEGDNCWEIVKTIMNGEKKKVRVYKKWGVVDLGGCILILEQYPLIELRTIEMS